MTSTSKLQAKVNVYFDNLDEAWKVDSTAFGVANEDEDTGEDYEDIEARIIAATGDEDFSIGEDNLKHRYFPTLPRRFRLA